MTEFSRKIIEIISNIKHGEYLSYGEIAELAGNSRGARQVARILSTCSRKYKLPWHRVVNSKYAVSINDPYFKQIQIDLLRSEGVSVNDEGKIKIE